MSKILVVSDSHGDDVILERLVERYASEVDVMIHTGDSEFLPDNSLRDKFKLVIGNMDFTTEFPRQLNLTVGSTKIFVTHGHFYNVNFGLDEILNEGKKNSAQVILYGHTHQLAVEMRENILLLNPGSISFPRGEYSYLHGTFAIIDIEPNSFTIQYYLRDCSPVSDLKFQYNRG